MLVHVEVTQEDIDQGEPVSVNGCAFQRALQRYLNVPVWASQWNIGVGPDRVIARPTKEIIAWMDVFDRNKSEAKPASFELEIPDQYVLREGAPC